MVANLGEVYANQGMRDAWVLSAIDNRALVEYVMPEGRTFLRILPIDGIGYIDWDAPGRSVSYNAIPRKFLEDMRDNFSVVLGIIAGGFDGEVVSQHYKRVRRFAVSRAEARALAVRARILDLKVNDKEVSS
jgi:hypothetical protein